MQSLNEGNNSPIRQFGVEKKKRNLFYPFVIIAVILGIVTGFTLSRGKTSGIAGTGGPVDVSSEDVKTGSVFGGGDDKVFRDEAEGTLEDGGVDGEGTHKLIRPGGESQNVYLTSTVLDLNQFTGKKIRVWGETHAAQKAGWLMDVGKVEVL